MRKIFDKNTIAALSDRIHMLTPESKSLWGKMNVSQMLRHCIISEELFLGRKHFKRLFIGRLFGAIALKNILKNEDPLKKNLPTNPAFKMTGSGDVEKEKQTWIQLLHQYENYRDQDLIHPFFGAMTKEKIGYYVYKHTDHHLRQFGV